MRAAHYDTPRPPALLLQCGRPDKEGPHVAFTPIGRASRCLLVAALVTAAIPSSPLYAQTRIDGLWEATVAAGGVDVPFRFEIAIKGADAQGFFFEGDRKVGSTSGKFADGTLTL